MQKSKHVLENKLLEIATMVNTECLYVIFYGLECNEDNHINHGNIAVNMYVGGFALIMDMFSTIISRSK